MAWTALARTALARTSWTGRASTGQGRTRPGRRPAGLARAGLARAGLARAGLAGRLAALLPCCDAIAVTIAALVTGAGLARGGCYGVAVLLAMAAGGLYQRRIGSRVSDQAGRLAVAAALPAVVLLPWTPPGLALQLAGCTAGLVIALRWAAQTGLRSARQRGLLALPALVVGSGRPGSRVLGLLREHPELGLRPCGLLGNENTAGGQPVLGRLGEAGPVIDRFGIGQVLICSPSAGDGDLSAVVQACRDRNVPVSVMPQLPDFGLAVPRAGLDEIWATPFIPLRQGPGGRAAAVAKRTMDLALGSVFAVAAAPVTAVLAAAVRLDLSLPPLFRQVRVVGRGRAATITKLRTLRPARQPGYELGGAAGAVHAARPAAARFARRRAAAAGQRPARRHVAGGTAAGTTALRPAAAA